MYFLLADIGGTKTDLVLYDTQLKCFLSISRYYNKNYSCLEALIEDFIEAFSYPLEGMGLAVAGFIHENKCHMTNLPWLIDAQSIQKKFKVSFVYLLNDVEAYAWGVSHRSNKDMMCLRKGKDLPYRKLGVCLGTGLGAAYIHSDKQKIVSFASESGHQDFAPSNAVELSLLQYFLKTESFVSYETFLSGKGLSKIYQFFLDQPNNSVVDGKNLESPTVLPNMIVQKARIEKDPRSIQVIDLFFRILANYLSNLSLISLPMGGIYVGGGLIKHTQSLIDVDQFIKVFNRKKDLFSFIEDIPIYFCYDEDIILLGIQRYLNDLLSYHPSQENLDATDE
ncbi:MAG: ROK family protein [Rhabdochlamydiaceae bacterium]